MGEPNNALKTYMKRPNRIRDLMEYYLGEKLPEDWECREKDGFLLMRNTKGKLTYRERDYLGEASAWGIRFLPGIENQQSAVDVIDVFIMYPIRWTRQAKGIA